MGWFRAEEGISTDAKYRLIARRSGKPVPLVVAVWVHCLDKASGNPTRGMIDNLDVEVLADFLDCLPEDIESILEVMRRQTREGKPGMIDGDRVTTWCEHNPVKEDPTAARRKRAQRDRERERDALVAAETDRDPDDAGVTECDQTDLPSEERDKEQCHAVSRDVTQCHDTYIQTDRQTDSESAHPKSAVILTHDAEGVPDPPGFAEFWALYPKKTGKGAARRRWRDALRKAKHEAIMQGLAAAILRWRQERVENRFIPNPETWLNQERWSDQPPERPSSDQQYRDAHGNPVTDRRLDPRYMGIPG